MNALPPMPEPDVTPPPPHLSDEAAAWWWLVQADFKLEPHHQRLLQLCCEAWDRGQAARRELEAHGGVTFTDSKGQIRSHPAVAIQRDAAILFNRTLRELGLDAGAPGERSRPPALPDYRN